MAFPSIILRQARISGRGTVDLQRIYSAFSTTAISHLAAQSAPSQKEPPPPKKYKRIIFEEEEDTRPILIQKISLFIYRTKVEYYKYAKKNPFLFYGLPFMSVMVIGSYYLQEFTEIRYKTYDKARVLVSF